MPKSVIFHPAFFVQQKIFRLDVAVNDAFVVRELQRLADLRHDGQRLFWRQFPRLFDFAQVGAIHELHQQIVQRAGLAKVMNGDDVRMIEAGQGAGFAVEPLGKTGIAGHRRRQHLQGDQTVQCRLARLVNRPHAAPLMRPGISSCGKSWMISATGGGTNRAPAAPGTVPVGKPDLIRHSGHSPSGTSGGSGFRQFGQMLFVSIRCVLSPFT